MILWRLPFFAGCVLFASLASVAQSAFVAGVHMERQAWLVQAGARPASLGFRFEVGVSGAGIQRAHFFTPPEGAGSNNLSSGSSSWSFSTNFLASTLSSTNSHSAADFFNARFPAGLYHSFVETAGFDTSLGRFLINTNHNDVWLTNDFSAIDPVVTNIALFAPLTTTQQFIWRPFQPPSSASFTAFSLYEGQFDTNIFSILASLDHGFLSRYRMLTNFPRLSPSQNRVTVTNINSCLSHLLLLEFHNASDTPPSNTLVDGASTTLTALLYLPQPSEVRLNLQVAHSLVILTWPISVAKAFHPAWSADLTNWRPVAFSAITNDSFQYESGMPATSSARFYRLQSD